MEEVSKFIDDFISSEFVCNRAKYDISVDDDRYDQLRAETESYLHSVNSSSYGRGGSIANIIGDAAWEERYAKKMNKVRARTVHEVRQYSIPGLGDALHRIVRSTEIFAAFVSYDEHSARPVGFSSILFIADTDEGLKIIYRYSYSHKTGTWRHSHAHQPTQVLDSGTLVETLKLTPPEDEKSLEEYNEDPPRKLVAEPALS